MIRLRSLLTIANLRLKGENYDEVCEGAFLVALGKLGNMKTNQVPLIYLYIFKVIIEFTSFDLQISKSWVDAKLIVVETKYLEQTKVRPSKDFKLQHAGGYIDFIAVLFVHQDPIKSFMAMQTIGETSLLAGYGKFIVLPYDNLKQFHNEYYVRAASLAIQLLVQLSNNEKT
jgi:hypothetical protein